MPLIISMSDAILPLHGSDYLLIEQAATPRRITVDTFIAEISAKITEQVIRNLEEKGRYVSWT